MYDYGARNYDPALGRWMNIDALSERYYYNSNFSFVSNNPLVNMEIDGRWWWSKRDEKRAKRYADSYTSNINNAKKRITKLNERISKTDNAKKIVRLTDKIKNLDESIVANTKAIENLKTIEKDTEFGYTFNKIYGSQVAQLTYAGEKEHETRGISKQIVINFLNPRNATHEISHGADHARRLFSFSLPGTVFNYFPSVYNIMQGEVNAYSIEMGVHGKLQVNSDITFPENPSDITEEFVKSIYYNTTDKEGNVNKIYPYN